MRLIFCLFLLITPSISLACDGNSESPFPCEMNSMGIFTSDPAPNIKREKLQYYTASGFVDSKISHKTVTDLYEEVDKIAIDTLASSIESFGVLVRYKLSTEGDAVLEMMVRDKENVEDQLNAFKSEAVKLVNFNSIKDIVYIEIQYEISPIQ